jgi:hypothetical protein
MIKLSSAVNIKVNIESNKGATYMAKKFCFLALIMNVFMFSEANCEISATWDDITISTAELRKSIKVSISTNDDSISKISVTIGSVAQLIPPEALKNTKKPQLGTTNIGYWDEDKLDFFIGIKCGILSSFPNSPLPQIVFFIFKDGRYTHKEVYNATPNPNISLEFYRLGRQEK